MMHIAWIGLGSNQGDRRGLIHAAVDSLCRHPGVCEVRLSSLHDTEPVGGPPGQGRFLNAAAQVETTLDHKACFQMLQSIENALGRVRGERWGPRAIDLDLLLFDDLIIREDNLIVPHPRMHDRLFVLAPLAELGADIVHPVLGRTIRDLLADASVA